MTAGGAIRAEIDATGPITVARFMELALYGREGYYGGGESRTGRAGHFLTSPELDPIFGALWTGGFARRWEDAGRPSRFEVVEIGAGEGGFAHAVLESAEGDFAEALAYRIVEPIPRLQERQAGRLAAHRTKVSWRRTLEDLDPIEDGVVFANEVLDNLPVHVVEGDEEIYVDAGAEGFAEVRGPWSQAARELLDEADIEVPPGVRAEVPVAAHAFVSACAAAVRQGAVILIDYGDDWAGLVARPRGTLVCYSAGGADDAYLERPGEKDITSHANWSVAARALSAAGMRVEGPRPQREVLEELGLADVHRALRLETGAATAAGEGRRAVRIISRRSALGALADPGGLGGLGVLTGIR